MADTAAENEQMPHCMIKIKFIKKVEDNSQSIKQPSRSQPKYSLKCDVVYYRFYGNDNKPAHKNVGNTWENKKLSYEENLKDNTQKSQSKDYTEQRQSQGYI